MKKVIKLYTELNGMEKLKNEEIFNRNNAQVDIDNIYNLDEYIREVTLANLAYYAFNLEPVEYESIFFRNYSKHNSINTLLINEIKSEKLPNVQSIQVYIFSNGNIQAANICNTHYVKTNNLEVKNKEIILNIMTCSNFRDSKYLIKTIEIKHCYDTIEVKYDDSNLKNEIFCFRKYSPSSLNNENFIGFNRIN